MTPELHSKLQEIFEAAVNLAGSQRAAYLDQACAGDASLRQRVDQLLSADEETVFMAEPIPAAAQGAVKECPQCRRCYQSPQNICPGDGAVLQFAFDGSPLIDGKYLVERRLGLGGMGAVYLVQHTGLEKRFALKLIAHGRVVSQSFRESFENEARALGRLRHPNIVDVTDYGVDPRNSGVPYLVMEHLVGKTLSEILKQRKALPFEEAIGLLRLTAQAVDAAHANNIVHGDLKPANLFLAEEGHSRLPCLKVLDFGLARLTNPASSSDPDDETTLTSVGGLRGTPAYMAPELLRGEPASPASDRFALGVLTYELLTGHTPFGRSLREVQSNLGNSPRRPSAQNPSLPPEVDAPVLALLNGNPSDRPPTASAAVSMVARAWLTAEQRKWRSREWPRRWMIAAVATAVAVLASAGLTHLRVARVLEGRIADARFVWAPSKPPDPRLMLISIDDASLEADQRSLAERSGEFADMIDRIFASGASALAIDLLLPSRWSESAEFSKAVASHANRLVLALFAAPSGDLIGMECLNPLTAYVLGQKRYADLFGLVNLEEDEDRTVRRVRLFYLDQAGQRRPSFGERAVEAALQHPRSLPPGVTSLWIDYSVRFRQLSSISWKDVPERLRTAPELFRNRLVIAGANFAGNGDQHRVPRVASEGLISGQLLEALIVSTILAGNPVHEVSLLWSQIAAALVCFVLMASALCFPQHRWLSLAAWAILFCGCISLAFWVFRVNRTMIPVVGPGFTILLSMLAAAGLKTILKAYPMAEP